MNLNVDSSDAWRKQSRNIAQNQWRSRTCENCDHFKIDRLFIEDQLLLAQFFSNLIKKTPLEWARILTASLLFFSGHIIGYMGSIFHFHFDFLQENIGYLQYLSLSVKNDVTQWP